MQAEREYLVAIVDLYRALGGGRETSAPGDRPVNPVLGGTGGIPPDEERVRQLPPRVSPAPSP